MSPAPQSELVHSRWAMAAVAGIMVQVRSRSRALEPEAAQPAQPCLQGPAAGSAARERCSREQLERLCRSRANACAHLRAISLAEQQQRRRARWQRLGGSSRHHRRALIASSPALPCPPLPSAPQEIVKPDVFWYSAPTQIELPFNIMGLLAFEVRSCSCCLRSWWLGSHPCRH
jgi:hypothetical protein